MILNNNALDTELEIKQTNMIFKKTAEYGSNTKILAVMSLVKGFKVFSLI